MNPARIRTVSQGAGKTISQTRQAHRRLPFYINARRDGRLPGRTDPFRHIAAHYCYRFHNHCEISTIVKHS